MGKLVTAVVALTAGILVLGACGSSSSSGSKSKESVSASSSAPVQLAGKVTNKGTKDATGKSSIEIEADDFYFNPTFVKATPGASLSVELKNEGKQVHTFTIAGTADQMVNPGETKTIQVTVPTDGAFNFYCRFHRSMGMQGAIFTATGQSITSAGGGQSGATGGAATTATTAAATTTTSGSGSGSGYGY